MKPKSSISRRRVVYAPSLCSRRYGMPFDDADWVHRAAGRSRREFLPVVTTGAGIPDSSVSGSSDVTCSRPVVLRFGSTWLGCVGLKSVIRLPSPVCRWFAGPMFPCEMLRRIYYYIQCVCTVKVSGYIQYMPAMEIDPGLPSTASHFSSLNIPAFLSLPP